jgi:hypothetical protein
LAEWYPFFVFGFFAKEIVVKKLSLMATLVALVMAPGIVRAENDDVKKDVDVRVETRVSGQVMTIGPDGKVTVEKFGDDEAAGEKKGRRGKKPAAKSDTRVFSFGKAFKIGPDGKMEGVESLPKNIQELLKQAKPGTVSVDGSVTIIGPDGKKHTHALGDGKLDAESISKSIEKALQGAGTELPKEVQDQLKKALKDVPEVSSLALSGRHFGQDGISQRLDKILKRLDKLEKEVRDLKANQK